MHCHSGPKKQRRRGVSTVEFAVVIPVFFLFILALVEVLEDLRMNGGVPAENLRKQAVLEITAGKGTRFWPDAVDVASELLQTQEGLW